MKKKWIWSSIKKGLRTKTWKIMRLSAFFLLLFVSQVWAGIGYAQQTKLTLKMSDVRVIDVLDEIENSSEFYFLFNQKLVDVEREVDVDARETTIDQILDELFAETNVKHQLKDRLIILTTEKTDFDAETVASQQSSVSGTVTDQSGSPLPGVTILVKGTTQGTVTDFDGKYTIVNIPANATLQYSFVGMQMQEIEVINQTIINVSLVEESIGLDEVVAIGYGTMKKSDLTGSVTSVTSDEIKNYAITNVETALSGKLAGVYASSNSGQPGEGAAIRIRGIGTVNNNNPLYVVDGLFMDNMNDINPNDIERIEVLKDASSTAIYGSRGANGVIVITTKKGEKGDFVVSMDGYVGTTKSIYDPEMSSSEQLYGFLQESYSNDGLNLPSGLKELYERGVNTDWWDVSTRSGLTQNYNISIRGGSDKIKSALSVGYVSEDGFLKNTSYDRYTLHSYLEYKISDRLSVGANMNVVKSENREIRGFYEPIWQITSADPFSYVYNSNADKNDPEYRYNKYAPTEYSYTNNPLFLLETNNSYTKRFTSYGNLFADFEILKDLKYKVQFSFNKPVGYANNFDPKYALIPSELNIAATKQRTYNRVTTSMTNTWNTIWQHTLSYDKKIGEKHNVNAVVGVTYEDNLYEDISGQKNTTPGNGEEYWVLDAATDILSADGSRLENSIFSYLGRINYVYADKYLATVSFRADGSSRFSKDNRWGYFPSFSLGWRVNNENFFKNLELSNVSNLKFRLGWGQTGNQNIANDAAITTIGTSSTTIYTFGDNTYQAYGPDNVGNSDIRWETSEQTNLGLDLGLFNNKLQLTADYYIKKTKDMLLQLGVPSLAGYPNYPWTNAGSVKNNGFEFSANYQGRKNEFAYNIGINLSTYKNEVLSLGSGNEPIYYTGLKSAVTKTEVGRAIGLFYGYVQEGIFQNQQEIDNYVNSSGELIQPLAKPGDFKFADYNNDGVLNEDDRTYIGDPHPDLIYGINFSCNYKNFDLSTSFAGTIGNDMWNEYLFKGFATSTDNVPLEAYNNAWHQEGDNALYPRISQSDLNNNARTSSWYVDKGSYIRLKNIQLGYNLPQSLANKTSLFSSCRVYVSGQNLLTITNYNGMDPEVGSDDVLSLGVESQRYPSSKIISLGVNITF